MEQRAHFVMGEQRRAIAHGRREVADEISHGYLQLASVSPAAQTLVHPCAATFVRPRIEIDVESPAHVAVLIANFVNAHVRMPGLNPFDLADRNAVEAAY